MIDRVHSFSAARQQAQINVTLNIPEPLSEALMHLLTRAITPPVPTDIETTATWQPPPPADVSPVTPDPEPNNNGPITLLAAYDELLLPTRKRKAGHKTVKDHRSSLRIFDQWFAEVFSKKEGARSITPRPHVFPAIAAQPETIVADFARHRITKERNSLTTVNRRLTHINMVCAAAVEHGLLPALPVKPDKSDLRRMRAEWYESQNVTPKKTRRSAGAVTLDECSRLIEACDVATYPSFPNCSAPDFWRNLIRWHAQWGPRTQDIVSYRDLEKTGLCWDDVCDECPDEDVSLELPDLVMPHGCIYYLVGKAKNKENCWMLQPLTQWQREFIERFRGLDEKRVFPCSRNHKAWKKSWDAIREAGKVKSNVYLSQGTGNTRAMRKTSGRWWARTTGQDRVAQYLMHHAEVTTGRKHYLDTMVDVLPLLVRHMDSFELPAGADQ